MPERTAVVTHLAMWSGPRNISTAMMRSFGNRPQTMVTDEPFYAHYLLRRPEVNHPGRDEVIAAHETDPRSVIEELTGELPDGTALHYQKHMCHHMIEEVPTDWFGQVTHAFLIRDPRDVVRSFAKVMPELTLEDIGLPRQVALFDEIENATRQLPPVIDTDDVLANPERVLRELCERLGLSFTQQMLHWEPGPRASDGVWAKYWYDGVNASTGFARRTSKAAPVDSRYESLIAEAMPLYERLAKHRIR